jgi:hypothetical protein
MFDDESVQACFAECIFPGKRKHRVIDRGIMRSLIRFAVMLVVRIDPPEVADSDKKNGDQSDEIILSGGVKNLSMPCIVTDEG